MSQQSVKTKEHVVRISKSKKRYHAFRFHNTNGVKFNSDSKAELAREGLMTPKADWEPKAGAGTDVNREIARRRRFGFTSKGQSIDDLPWILTMKGIDEGKDKQFRAKRSTTENSSYFVFINNAEGGGFEAYPLEDWYTFAPYRTYKTLDIDEAEEEFSRRHKILNKYAIMANRRKVKADAEDEEEEGGKKSGEKSSAGGGGGGGASKKSSAWIEDEVDENLSDDDTDDEDKDRRREERLSDDDEDDNRKKKNAKLKAKRETKNNDDDEEEAKINEESDDGDHEGDEVDYSESSSDSDESDYETTKHDEKYEEKGIDEEKAIKALEEEEDEDDEDNKLTEEGKEYKKLITQKSMKEDDEASKDSAKKSSDRSGDSDHGSDGSEIGDPDEDPTIPSLFMDTKKSFGAFASNDLPSNTSASEGKTKAKRKATDDISSHTSKRNKDESKTTATSTTSAASSGSASTSLMFEDEVRRYLKRKTMTVKEIIKKIKKTNTNLSNEEINAHLTNILNKLKQTKEFKCEEKSGVKYLSLT